MSVIKEVLKEEENRLQRMLGVYEKQLKELPRGSIQIKIIKGHEYFYIAYRKPGSRKLFFDYIKSQVTLNDLKNKIEKRKYFEVLVKEIKKELKGIKKVVKHDE